MNNRAQQFTAQTICPAKINLHLQVGELCKQGEQSFHRVCTLLQAVHLQQANDQLELTLSHQIVRTAGEVQILLEVQPQEPCALQYNLVYRATRVYLKKAAEIFGSKRSKSLGVLWPQKISFCLYKHIPQQAGLGGASSNAAAALKLLNQCLPVFCASSPLCDRAMQKLASSLGCDVPFFLREFTSFGTSLAWGLGRGERIVPISNELELALWQLQNRLQLWLTKPRGVFCNTQKMYALLDQRSRRVLPQAAPKLQCSHLEIEQKILAAPSEIKNILFNDFYLVCNGLAAVSEKNSVAWAKNINQLEIEGFQVLAKLFQYLYSLSAFWAGLSGSGSAFFVWFLKEHSRKDILGSLAKFPQPLEIFAVDTPH